MTTSASWLGMSYGTAPASAMKGSMPPLTNTGNRRDVTEGEVRWNFNTTGRPCASSAPESWWKLTGR